MAPKPWSGPALELSVVQDTGREFKGTETCGHAMTGKDIPQKDQHF